MTEKNDFIDQLLSKKNDELDEILSYADNIKTDSSDRIRHSNADEILEEITKSRSLNKNTPPADNTTNTEKFSAIDTKNIQFTRILPTSHNFHHIILQPEVCGNIPYKSIFDEKTNADTDELIIKEEKRSPEKLSENNLLKEVENSDNYDTEPEKPPENTSVNIPKAEKPDDSEISQAERFITNQEARHPRFYFILGLSIFVLTLLGLASCIYLGLNALRAFTDSYSGTAG